MLIVLGIKQETNVVVNTVNTLILRATHGIHFKVKLKEIAGFQFSDRWLLKLVFLLIIFSNILFAILFNHLLYSYTHNCILKMFVWICSYIFDYVNLIYFSPIETQYSEKPPIAQLRIRPKVGPECIVVIWMAASYLFDWRSTTWFDRYRDHLR